MQGQAWLPDQVRRFGTLGIVAGCHQCVRPLSRTTRSAMDPITSLWVITAVVVPRVLFDVLDDLQHLDAGPGIHARPLVHHTSTLPDVWRWRGQWRPAAARHRTVALGNDPYDWPDQPAPALPQASSDRVRYRSTMATFSRARQAGNHVVELEYEPDMLSRRNAVSSRSGGCPTQILIAIANAASAGSIQGRPEYSTRSTCPTRKPPA